MENEKFSFEELQEWEALQIRGGAAGNEDGILAQNGCINSVSGCGGGDVDQDKCSNTALGCGVAMLITCAMHKTTTCTAHNTTACMGG